MTAYTPCVYRVTNSVNGHIYVGVHHDSKNEKYLGSGDGIKAAICKYGRDVFRKDILAEMESLRLAYYLESEIVTKTFVARPDTYNRTAGGKIPPSRKGKRVLGLIPSTEARAKMRAAKVGRVLTAEHRAKIAAAGIGRKNPPISEQTRERLRASHRGIRPSVETRHKMSIARKGKKGISRPCSSEHRAKLSLAMKEYFANRHNG